MKVLAAVCGILIVLLGLWSTGRSPTEVQSAVEIGCLVGGLILCVLAVVIARIDGVSARLAALEAALQGDAPFDEEPEPVAVPEPVDGTAD